LQKEEPVPQLKGTDRRQVTLIVVEKYERVVMRFEKPRTPARDITLILL
jgi:hypothetical protein